MDQTYTFSNPGQNFSGFRTFQVQTDRGPYIIRRLGTGYGENTKIMTFKTFDSIILSNGSRLCLVLLNKTESPNVWVKLSCEKPALYYEMLV